MAHTCVSALFHCVFSTKDRQRVLTQNHRERLFAYIGGIARENGFKLLGAGGVEDHVHLLLSLSSTMPIAKAMQLAKGGSSKWLREEFAELGSFAWQEGYGAFGLGVSQLDATLRYIERQVEHHRKLTFEEEYRAFLHKHGMKVDEAYQFG